MEIMREIKIDLIKKFIFYQQNHFITTEHNFIAFLSKN